MSLKVLSLCGVAGMSLSSLLEGDENSGGKCYLHNNGGSEILAKFW
jgi:hypothetical protein